MVWEAVSDRSPYKPDVEHPELNMDIAEIEGETGAVNIIATASSAEKASMIVKALNRWGVKSASVSCEPTEPGK